MTNEQAIIIINELYDDLTNEKNNFNVIGKDERKALIIAINTLKEKSCEDAISRQHIIEQYKSCADMLSDEELEGADLVMEWVYKAPSVNSQEPKILETIDFAIDASNGNTNYFVGFRNGLRYAKSLIDGKEPNYESCAKQEPSIDDMEREYEKAKADGKKVLLVDKEQFEKELLGAETPFDKLYKKLKGRDSDE